MGPAVGPVAGPLEEHHQGHPVGEGELGEAMPLRVRRPADRARLHREVLGADEDPGRVREAYGDAIYDRLAAVKAKYDPDNVFHHNQNIGPREMTARTVAA